MNLENFYQEVRATETSCSDLTGAGKTVVLFRVALETGAREMGMLSVLHLISKLMTATLGIMNDDDECSFEEILDEFEVENKISH
jgi:hypothetical protein|tara:strand:+ start:4562 stop:4816 length:255 start_codon:yes stop_codon:yes gene_type:complete